MVTGLHLWIPSTLCLMVVTAGYDRPKEKTQENWCEKSNLCEQVCVDSYTGYYCQCRVGYSLVKTPDRKCTDCHQQLDLAIILHSDFNAIQNFANYSIHFSVKKSRNVPRHTLLPIISELPLARTNVQVALLDNVKVNKGIVPDYRLFMTSSTDLKRDIISHSNNVETRAYTLATKLDYIKAAFVSQDTGNRYFAPNLAIVYVTWTKNDETSESWEAAITSASLLEVAGVHTVVVVEFTSSASDMDLRRVVTQFTDIASDEKSLFLVRPEDPKSVTELNSEIRKLIDETSENYCYASQACCFLTEDSGLKCACVTTTQGVFPLNGTQCKEEVSFVDTHGSRLGEFQPLTHRQLSTESLLELGWLLALTNCALLAILAAYIHTKRRLAHAV